MLSNWGLWCEALRKMFVGNYYSFLFVRNYYSFSRAPHHPSFPVELCRKELRQFEVKGNNLVLTSKPTELGFLYLANGDGKDGPLQPPTPPSPLTFLQGWNRHCIVGMGWVGGYLNCWLWYNADIISLIMMLALMMMLMLIMWWVWAQFEVEGAAALFQLCRGNLIFPTRNSKTMTTMTIMTIRKIMIIISIS